MQFKGHHYEEVLDANSSKVQIKNLIASLVTLALITNVFQHLQTSPFNYYINIIIKFNAIKKIAFNTRYKSEKEC